MQRHFRRSLAEWWSNNWMFGGGPTAFVQGAARVAPRCRVDSTLLAPRASIAFVLRGSMFAQQGSSNAVAIARAPGEYERTKMPSEGHLGTTLPLERLEQLPFWVTAPGETDGFLIVVGAVLVLVLLGFGALYFTIQAIPDRMATGTHKVQMQLVGILGLLSLFTLNNAFWIAAILIAAVPLHEVLPLKSEGPPEREDA